MAQLLLVRHKLNRTTIKHNAQKINIWASFVFYPTTCIFDSCLIERYIIYVPRMMGQTDRQPLPLILGLFHVDRMSPLEREMQGNLFDLLKYPPFFYISISCSTHFNHSELRVSWGGSINSYLHAEISSMLCLRHQILPTQHYCDGSSPTFISSNFDINQMLPNYAWENIIESSKSKDFNLFGFDRKQTWPKNEKIEISTFHIWWHQGPTTKWVICV